MVEMIAEQVTEIKPPDVSHLVTEDDTPVDNIFSERQQRLLVEPLYSSWQPGRSFVALANVGLYASVRRPALVPDVLLSLDVALGEDIWAKEHRSYLVWEFGKPPDVVIEVVSNRVGREAEEKMRDYARMGIPYYVIFDPQQLVLERTLAVFERHASSYVQKREPRLDAVGLSLTLWQGRFEGWETEWLRWSTLNDQILPTGAERAEEERERAEEERERAERLAAQLRALGIDPEG